MAGFVRIALILAVLAVLFVLIRSCAKGTVEPPPQGGGTMQGTGEEEERWYGAPEIDVQLLTPNPYSRPQLTLGQVNGIVVHYVANPGSTAQNNRDYFENIGKSGENSVSSHFVVGLQGEIIQCIPTSEVAYASNHRNSDTVSIECCHPDETGQFTQETYDSLVKLVAWLCSDKDVPVSGVIRHYDVTGKICPKYFVDHPDAWEQFRSDVAERLAQLQEKSL